MVAPFQTQRPSCRVPRFRRSPENPLPRKPAWPRTPGIPGIWRNRSEFIEGRAAIVKFLTRKWEKELDYRLIKDLWAFDGNHIAVRFQYEWHDAAGQWHRSYGNELWEFDENGLMRRREASINDTEIAAKDRRFHWAAPGPRPADIPGLSTSPF
jgi:nuclear transport factor 2 (NTF2) superfamily protein